MKPIFLGFAMLVLVLSFAANACEIKGVAKSISGDTRQRVIQQTLKRKRLQEFTSLTFRQRREQERLAKSYKVDTCALSLKQSISGNKIVCT
jgi:hypothetical protein